MNFIKGLENLLEQVDQTAQKVLKHDDGAGEGVAGEPGRGDATRGATTASGGRTATPGRFQPSTRPASKPKSDDEIFAFLNTPATTGPVSPTTSRLASSPARASNAAATSRAVSSTRGSLSMPSTPSAPQSSRPRVKATSNTAGVGRGKVTPNAGSTPSSQPPERKPADGGAKMTKPLVGEKPSSPKAERGHDNTRQKETEENTKGIDSSGEPLIQASSLPPTQTSNSASLLVDTSDADTEKEPSEGELRKPQEVPLESSSAPELPLIKDVESINPRTAALTSEGDQQSATSGLGKIELEQKARLEGYDEDNPIHEKQPENDDDDAHRTSGGESEGDVDADANEEEEPHDSNQMELSYEDQNPLEEEVTEDNEEGQNDGNFEDLVMESSRSNLAEETARHLQEQIDSVVKEKAKLQLENKLMRSEVRALNDEVTSLTERITSEHEALERANDALHALQMEVHDKTRQLMGYRKQEEELDSILAKKDAQHAALQVKLEEANIHIAAFEQTMNALKQEIDRLNKEKEETTEMHKQSITLINAKILELEGQLKEERENASAQRSTALERERNLESDISEYTKALGQAQRAIEEKNKQLEKHLSVIKDLESNVQSMKQELADYKMRAKKVLQQREATIQELTEKLTSPGASSPEEAKLQEKWKELMLQKQEYEQLKNELDETKDELAKLRGTLAQTQEQAEHDSLEFEEQIKSLEDELEKERERVRRVQFELAQRTQELNATKDQMVQTTNILQEQIKDREAQISKLKRQITVKGIQSQSTSQAELESSLSAMTDRLIRLQALNETLTNEKAALQMRLNSEIQSRREREGGRLETRHSADISSIIIDTSGGDKADSGPRLRSIASLVPESWSGDPQSKRHQVYTQTIRAASAVDAFATHVGRILRRNPLARLLLLLYMVFLHVWVLFLLSRPLEIHDMLDGNLPPGAVAPTGIQPDAVAAAAALGQ